MSWSHRTEQVTAGISASRSALLPRLIPVAPKRHGEHLGKSNLVFHHIVFEKVYLGANQQNAGQV